jgi:hypothetical protein
MAGRGSETTDTRFGCGMEEKPKTQGSARS